ncbi:MAG: helix-turn-helix domain-containing protein [Micromonosporaceae bacterium]
MDMRELMLEHDPRIGEAVRAGRHGELLRIARQVRGLTLQKAGQQLGYSASFLSRLETGQRTLTIDMLRHLAAGYEIPPGMLGLATATVLPSAPQRLIDARRTHGGYAAGDSTRFLSAETAICPGPIADALEIPRDSEALRRDQLTYHGDEPVRLSITWVPQVIAVECPALLDGEPGEPVTIGISGLIAEATGRIATGGEDRVEGCVAWPGAARLLGRKEGFAMLRTLLTWWDHAGVIQVAETITPHTVRYPYDLPAKRLGLVVANADDELLETLPE